jgi:hypothetical protein
MNRSDWLKIIYIGGIIIAMILLITTLIKYIQVGMALKKFYKETNGTGIAYCNLCQSLEKVGFIKNTGGAK